MYEDALRVVTVILFVAFLELLEIVCQVALKMYISVFLFASDQWGATDSKPYYQRAGPYGLAWIRNVE